ncbi:pilus assembly protein [Bordetella ansorpii]|uniref:Pilus assembly protein n=1 Tax=Bordetella ansorpii TaxID=288768 RepID=A0A157RFY6_9BORD|nr:hypothetical protein [Bordetella ansorpii]SAI56883.1 pilus assembly protein [Bordetella ansorpii]
MTCVPRVRASGQALVPAVALLGLCAVAWVSLYNVGQTAAARTRLTHAADAAAYSAALAQARTLNMLAYVNRAQIAHQVAMAHLATLASWARFSGTQAQRRAAGNPPAYLIGSMFGAKALQGYLAAQATSGMAAQFARRHAEHDALVHGTLAQVANRQVSQLPAQRHAMLRAVLRANYPEWDGASDAPQWRVLDDGLPGFVRAQRGGDASDMARMVRTAAARYEFLRPRDITRRNAWMVSRSCPERRHELRRRGATQMDARGRWSANDTLSYHALRENHWIGCHYREYAMGWGLAGRDDGKPIQRAPEDFSQEDFWRWVDQNTSWDIIMGVTNPLASAYGEQARVSLSGRGMAGYHEVPESRAGTPLRFAVAVRQDGASVPTTAGSSSVGVAGCFDWRALQGGSLTVTSAAETFFARPQPRDDGKDELATLFRPYWQARRVAVTKAESLAARRLP